MLEDVTRQIDETVTRMMNQVGEAIANRMRVELMEGDHIDTGNLLNSIRHETETSEDAVTTTIYADAANEKGTQYGEFIEMGTGIYRIGGGGRTEPWTYYSPSLDRFVTTEGMEADPFMEPALAHVMDGEEYEELVTDLLDTVGAVFAERIADVYGGGTND